MRNRRSIAIFALLVMTIVFIAPNNSNKALADTVTTSGAKVSGTTLADIPAQLKSSVEWVYNNRMIVERTPSLKNLIYDQIFAGKGTLNYVVRWQTSKNITLEQRKKVEVMLNRHVDNWVKHLKGYDGWPYDTVKVKVVGWACKNPAQILNKQPDEIVYTDCIKDDMNKTDSKIPIDLPTAPESLSRFAHYRDANYSYPGGLDKRFDMYLWATTTFGGGHGGDWGQRMSEDYILENLDAKEATILSHEIGHGFGLPDFYKESERPPQGFSAKTIMWAWNSTVITEWDAWLLRYTWSQIKKDTARFPVTAAKSENKKETVETSAPTTTVNPIEAPTATVKPTEAPSTTIESTDRSAENSTDRSAANPSPQVTKKRTTNKRRNHFSYFWRFFNR